MAAVAEPSSQPKFSEPPALTPSSSPGVAIASSRPDLAALAGDKQRAVLELLLEGHSEPFIAEQLGRSRHTVHDHTKTIYSNLGVKSRVQLVLLFSAPRTN